MNWLNCSLVNCVGILLYLRLVMVFSSFVLIQQIMKIRPQVYNMKGFKLNSVSAISSRLYLKQSLKIVRGIGRTTTQIIHDINAALVLSALYW